jgi:hypothetical protein
MESLILQTEEQKNKLDSLINNDTTIQSNFEKLNKYMSDEFERRSRIIKRTDEAFLNSILSFAVYEQNNWMFKNLNSELSDMGAIFNDAMQNKEKLYNLKVWHFMKNTFEKIPDQELGMRKSGYFYSWFNSKIDFDFKDGQYNAANGLAHACILRSKNPNKNRKGDILHLSFRGTEFSRLMEYIKGPYLDMSAYYENFKPLVEQLKKYANNPKNNIAEIHVSGHSLGGAMVQEFFKKNPPEEFAVPVKGFTFGSPGSEKKWYHKFATIAYHTLVSGVAFSYVRDDQGITNDDRITQYSHENDPVPLVGGLGYIKGDNNYSLPDNAYRNDKIANLESPSFLEKIPAFGKLMSGFKEKILNKLNTKFHDSARYIMNIRSYIQNSYLDKEQHFKDFFILKNTPNWQNWVRHERSFSMLSIKYKSAFELLIKENNPELDNNNVIKKILEVRERMRFDSQADIVLSKFKNNNASYDKDERITLCYNNIYFDKNGNANNKNISKEDLEVINDPVQSIEKIKKMRQRYTEKMKDRELIFKKSN